MTSDRRQDLTALALLIVIALALFADVVAGSGVFYFRDFLRYYFPAKKMLRDIVAGGEFPWWTRAFSAGQPLAANPEHEVFYPLTWLILLPRFTAALHFQVLLHIALALAGMYAFLRSIGLRTFAAFFGALSFGLGGLMLSYLCLLPYLYCAAWLPLTCLFTRKFLREGSPRDLALASLSLGMQLLIGEPTTIAQTLMLIGGYAIYRAWKTRQVRPVAYAAAIIAAALFVGAAQVVPAIDHVRDSARARPFEFVVVSSWSMPWAKLLELVYPNALGHLIVNGVSFYWGANLYGASRSPFLPNIYPGLLTTVLAMAGFATWRKGAGFVLALCAVSIVIAAGGHTPLLRLLYDLGLAKSTRYFEKFILVAIFALVVFAAQSLDALMSGDARLAAAGRKTALVVTALAIAMFAWSMTPAYSRVFTDWFPLGAAGAMTSIQMSRFDWMIAAARGLAVFLLLRSSGSATRPLWMLFATVLFVADISRLAPEIAPRLPAALYAEPPVARAFPRGPFRIFHEADLLRDIPVAHQWTAEGRAPWVLRNGLFPMLNAAWGLDTAIDLDVDRTALLPTADFMYAARIARGLGGERALAMTMAMSNTRYRAIYRPFSPDVADQDPEMLRPVVFLDQVRQPRYYFGWPVVPVRDPNDFAGKIASGAFPPSTAFVGAPLRVDAAGTVRAFTESTNSATIDVESAGHALLVMSVTPHKYWRLSIDGRTAAAIVTNIGYQGVLVPPGMHRVVMRYRNGLAIASLISSAMAVVALSVLMFVRRRRP